MRATPSPLFFRLPETSENLSRLTNNNDTFLFEPEPEKKETLRFYDTFDWKAWKTGNHVVLNGRKLIVYDLKSCREVCSAPLRRVPRSFFPDTVDHKETAARLRAIAKLRAFIQFGSVETAVQRWRLLDDNKKTVATVELQRLAGNHQNDSTICLTLFPVRGYDRFFEIAAAQIRQSCGKPAEITFRVYYSTLMEAAGAVPGDYSSKPSVKLDPRDTILDSSKSLLLSALDVLYANEEWIPKHIDTEFLHDYRVAVRRIRSILAQFKGVFPPDTLAHYKNAFRELGKRTNNLRDQDVYLLQEQHFMSILPEPMRDSLKPFFTDLFNRQKKELRSFTGYIRSDAYKNLMREWEEFLRNDMTSDPATTPAAKTLTSDFAVATVSKAWKKAIRHGRSISSIATDTELHSLRIDCKKLRYLLEFYASVFPARTLQKVLKQLKTLQNNLGVFVDLSVQQSYLFDYLSTLKPDTHAISFSAAIGGLITALHHEREKTRQNFHNAFNTFDSDETETLFHALLKKHR